MELNKEDIVFNYKDIKEELREVIINKKITDINEPVSICEGIATMDFRPYLYNTALWGGGDIPMVILVGTETGKLYFFSLYILLPHLKDKYTEALAIKKAKEEKGSK